MQKDQMGSREPSNGQRRLEDRRVGFGPASRHQNGLEHGYALHKKIRLYDGTLGRSVTWIKTSPPIRFPPDLDPVTPDTSESIDGDPVTTKVNPARAGAA